MKKLLLFSMLAAVASFSSSADTYKLVFANSALATGETHDLDASFVVDGFKFDVAKNEGSTAPAFNKSGDVRLYAKNTMTISCKDAKMTSMTFAVSTQGQRRLTSVTANPGTVGAQAAGDKVVTWSGDASSTTFTVGEKAIYGSDGEAKAGQFDFTEVTIVTDGPITPYEGGTVTPPTTVEATTVAELLAVPNGREFHFEGELVVSYHNGPDCYVFDATGATLLYSDKNDPWASTLAQGTVITELSGKRNDYKQTIEFIPAMTSVVIDGHKDVTPKKVTTASELTVDDYDYLVQLINVKISDLTGNDNRNATITFADGTTTAAYYKFFSPNSYTPCPYPENLDKQYNVLGIGSTFNNAPQLSFISAEEYSGVADVIADGQVSVIGNNIYAPAGAQIYAINGSRTGSTNLPAGIYVVRVADKAVKVLVK